MSNSFFKISLRLSDRWFWKAYVYAQYAQTHKTHKGRVLTY